ncbi:hypothetical protein VNO78_09977 [Psophocarpus tetragonolobus]|uniref:Golgin candidate 2 n=1 Tax=Psophocarpus tetragonolobus TaxID=3891 RepID=A0AAN9SJ04_PSOTE
MANWISSKLKAAENILHQIDQQAAESLRKNESFRSQEPSIDAPAKSGSPLSLKDQLKKKPLDSNEYRGKLRSDPNFNGLKATPSAPKLSPKSAPTLTDDDWTELLSAPASAPPPTPTPSIASVSGGNHGPRPLSKSNSRKQKGLSSGLLISDVKRNPRIGHSDPMSLQKSDSVNQVKFSGKASDDWKESTSSTSTERNSTVESESDSKWGEGAKYADNDKDSSEKLVLEEKRNEENEHHFKSRNISLPESLLEDNKTLAAETLPPWGVDEDQEAKIVEDVDGSQLRSEIKGRSELHSISGNSISDDLKRGSPVASYGSSDSDTDSGSTSDSESEHEREERRKRRERILAEKAAAKAINAIKERENMVAKLEGEKESLEKILEERAKQQAQEASQLQSSMMETMEAVELEKQKHNNTRMEVLTRLAKLETTNADLARSLAAVQWNLEVEVKQVAELRQQITSKELFHEELRRIKNPHHTGTKQNQLASKGVEFEREILEAEHSLINDKVAQLQEKARKLEADIEMTRKEIEEPTEVEVELKRRLQQMTDHLIQKQAKVESLSSEKASLVFRIEAVSRLLDENMSASGAANMNPASSSSDLEAGLWLLSHSKLKPMLKARIHSGKRQLGSLLEQLDYLFVIGALFLKRNSTAKFWALIYLVCLHFWVFYILLSHSSPSNEGRSGAQISLENINNTGGI